MKTEEEVKAMTTEIEEKKEFYYPHIEHVLKEMNEKEERERKEAEDMKKKAAELGLDENDDSAILDIAPGCIPGMNAGCCRKTVKVDPRKEIVWVCLRFSDGRMLKQNFNPRNKVEDLFTFAEAALGTKEFRMVADFPCKPLMDKSLTLIEAKLENSTVVVRS